jgi:selenocysteine lyase/cysteine desulfurase
MWYSGVTGQKMRRYPGLKVMVDGAHMLGQVPVDVNSMHADYFATNCHKWLCGARGSAVLWVAEKAQAGFEPLVKSHGHGSGFTSDFIWSGAQLVLSCCRTNTTSVI